MKFYKEADGDWIINGEIIPAGTCRQKTESATGRITIKLIGAPLLESTLALKMLPTDFQDVNGNYYADLAAYELATSDFFVDAALAAAEQLEVEVNTAISLTDYEVSTRIGILKNTQLQLDTISEYINSLFAKPTLMSIDKLVNYYVISTIDSSKNFLLTKSGSESFTWSLFDQTQNNTQFTFKLTNSRTYFVLAADSVKCVAISLGWGIADFGNIVRWFKSGATENVVPAFSDQSGKGASGDTVKVERISTGWMFSIKRSGQSTFVYWFTRLFYANFETEFLQSDSKYGVAKYSATANENMMSNIEYIPNILSLPKINKWASKKWNAIGDSITWLNVYEPIVQSGLSILSYNNYGYNGYTTEMLNGVKSSWSTDADIITVFIGTNDFGRCNALSNTRNYMLSILEYLKTTNPTKKIAVFLPTQRWGYTGDTVFGPQPTMTNSIGITLRQYCETIKDIANSLSIPVCDLYYLSGINPQTISKYTYDGLHPNSLGMQVISELMVDFLNTL